MLSSNGREGHCGTLTVEKFIFCYNYIALASQLASYIVCAPATHTHIHTHTHTITITHTHIQQVTLILFSFPFSPFFSHPFGLNFFCTGETKYYKLSFFTMDQQKVKFAEKNMFVCLPFLLSVMLNQFCFKLLYR